MCPAIDCSAAQESLRALLQEGVEPGAEALEHWRSCPACRALAQFAAEGLPPVEASAPVAPTPELKAQVRNQIWRLALGRTLFALGMTVALLGLWAALSWNSFWDLGLPGAVGIFGVLLLPLLLVLPLGLWPRRHRLYKRLCRGRELSGVCLGLAERTGTPVWLWRAGFAVLFLLQPWVLGIYALLAVAMPVHPEDRAGLFRFKVARLYHRWVG